MSVSLCALFLLASQQQPDLTQPNQAKYQVIESITLPGMEKKPNLKIELRKFKEPERADTGVELWTITAKKANAVGIYGGGSGLMCTLKDGKYLYMVYSWGSGMHRSCIDRISVSGDDFKVEKLDAVPYYDVFLTKDGNDFRIDSGRCLQLNKWSQVRTFGWMINKKDGVGFLQPDKKTPISSLWDYCQSLEQKRRRGEVSSDSPFIVPK